MPEDLDSRWQKGAGSSPLQRTLLYLKSDVCSGASDPSIPGPRLCPEVIGGKVG